MPRITVKHCANYDAITRPVAHSIARDVMTLCDIPLDTPLHLLGEFETVGQPGTKVGDRGDDVVFESNTRLIVQADDTTRWSSILNQVVRGDNDLPPMFQDTRLGIYIRPVYVQSDLVLNFRYTTETRQGAQKWRDEIAVRTAENRGAIQHEIKYDILIQDGVLNLMATLWDMREKIAGYGESFVEWFKACCTRPWTGLGALDGDLNKIQISVPEKQAQLTGWFTFSEVPKERKTDGNSTWEIEFEYHVMYHRCTHLYIVYPLMVHQQHVPRQYFDDRPRFSVEELKKSSAISVRALDALDGNVDSLPPPMDGVRFPAYDEWIPMVHSQPPYTTPCMTWMIQLDPKDPADILNLGDIDKMRFTLEMDTYLRTFHDKITVMGGAVCMLTLYCDDMPMDQTILTMDANLNVRSTIPLDLRKQYHLRLSFGTRYMLFTDAAIKSMQTHPIATLQCFQTMVPRLGVEWAQAHLLAGQYLSKEYIQWFYNYLQDHSVGESPEGAIPPWGTGSWPTDNGNSGNNPGESGGSNWNNDRPLVDTDPDELFNHNFLHGGRYVQFLAIVATRAS